MKFFRTPLFTALVLALVTAAPVARADVTFNLNTVINGATPAGASPWLTATFQDIAAGDVKLTLTNNMPAGEFIPFLVFNSILNPTSLTFTNNTPLVATAGVTTSATQSLNGGANMKAGFFNVLYAFTIPNNTGGRFDGGETSIWEITGGSITSANFLKTSIADGNNPGGWLMAADVRGIPCPTCAESTTSGSIGARPEIITHGVPEPETYAMLLAGLGLMGFVARRRKQKTA